MVVPKGSQRVDDAVNVMKFLLSDEVQVEVYAKALNLTTRTDMVENKYFQAEPLVQDVAKALALGLGKPIYGVNHLAAHVAVDQLEHGPLPEPCLAMLVSGGHSSLLEVTDVTVGDGDEAQSGSTVNVHYLGVEYDSGEEFDSSWSRGEPINFPLQALVRGWQEGIPGMKVGGRRELVVPPHLAYGPAGGGHPLSGKTLIFVIDLLGVS